MPKPFAHGRRAAVAVAVATLLSVSACGTSGSVASSPSSGVAGTITVLAAASLTGTFTTLADQFQTAHPGTRVVTSFGSSATLATQIANGAPADVFASASTAPLTLLTQKNLVAAPTTFAHNTLEIAVAPGNPHRVRGLQDLPQAGKVVLCAPTVPCGAAAEKALAKAKVVLKPASFEVDVKAALRRVSSAEADASVVYVTDIKAAGSSVQGVPIAAADNVTNDYPIAKVATSKNSALASAFVDFIESPAGQKVLIDAGFQAA